MTVSHGRVAGTIGTRAGPWLRRQDRHGIRSSRGPDWSSRVCLDGRCSGWPCWSESESARPRASAKAVIRIPDPSPETRESLAPAILPQPLLSAAP